MFFQLSKVDEEKRLVYGIATAEEVDKSGEICDYASTKPHYEAWSDEFRRATDGGSLGNLRSMHGKVAAGKVVDLELDDDLRQVRICAKVVDDQEWRKVLEGVYTGFSQGGAYVRKWEDPDAPGVRRYTAKPSEVSLVDTPCLTTARFEIMKADGAVEEREFAKYSDDESRNDHGRWTTTSGSSADESSSTPHPTDTERGMEVGHNLYLRRKKDAGPRVDSRAQPTVGQVAAATAGFLIGGAVGGGAGSLLGTPGMLAGSVAGAVYGSHVASSAAAPTKREGYYHIVNEQGQSELYAHSSYELVSGKGEVVGHIKYGKVADLQKAALAVVILEDIARTIDPDITDEEIEDAITEGLAKYDDSESRDDHGRWTSGGGGGAGTKQKDNKSAAGRLENDARSQTTAYQSDTKSGKSGKSGSTKRSSDGQAASGSVEQSRKSDLDNPKNAPGSTVVQNAAADRSRAAVSSDSIANRVRNAARGAVAGATHGFKGALPFAALSTAFGGAAGAATEVALSTAYGAAAGAAVGAATRRAKDVDENAETAARVTNVARSVVSAAQFLTKPGAVRSVLNTARSYSSKVRGYREAFQDAYSARRSARAAAEETARQSKATGPGFAGRYSGGGKYRSTYSNNSTNAVALWGEKLADQLNDLEKLGVGPEYIVQIVEDLAKEEEFMTISNADVARRAGEIAKAAGDETKWPTFVGQAREELSKYSDSESRASDSEWTSGDVSAQQSKARAAGNPPIGKRYQVYGNHNGKRVAISSHDSKNEAYAEMARHKSEGRGTQLWDTGREAKKIVVESDLSKISEDYDDLVKIVDEDPVVVSGRIPSPTVDVDRGVEQVWVAKDGSTHKKKADAISHNEELAKRDYSTEQRGKMADKGQAKDDGSYPIKTRADVSNAVRDFGRAKGSASDKAHIKARAKAIGAEDALPDDWRDDGDSKDSADKSLSAEDLAKKVLGKLDEVGKDPSASRVVQFSRLRKFCGTEAWDAQRAMQALQIIIELVYKEMSEDENEDEQVAQLKSAMDSLKEFIASEIMENHGDDEDDSDDADDSDGETDPTMQMFRRIGELVKAAGGSEELAKRGARNSEADKVHLKAAHDHLVALEPSCCDGGGPGKDEKRAGTDNSEDEDSRSGSGNPEKTVVAGDLSKALEERDTLRKAIEAISPRLESLGQLILNQSEKIAQQTDEIEALKKTPSPPPRLRVVEKGSDTVAAVDSGISSEELHKRIAALPPKEQAELFVKAAQQRPMTQGDLYRTTR